ncbi:hypothetical protein M8818_007288 [Zalaria obscura]|uniref:Uncharacterized protein n=1 Tax=Zalaria obscura TaxID=2024903 RepID=A0ACC3S5K5_9PEZI
MSTSQMNDHSNMAYGMLKYPPFAAEYDSVGPYSIGRDARLQLERSHAIKCPPIICHLATLKKVQEVLSKPGELEKFLSADEAAQIRRCDMPMYPLDESPAGLTGRSIATQLHSAKDYVLKPSLEGGGHNVYRKDIPDFLASIPMDEWHQYILMKMISPPSLDNILISSEGVYRGSVVSELGIFGTCMWRVKRTRERDEEKPEMLANNVGGWSLKTKREDVDEMSVIKGYGCFDSPLLVSSVLV